MKKIAAFITSVALVTLLWYLFARPYDYVASIKVNTFSGAINQSIKTWGASLKDSRFIEQTDLNHLKQQIKFNDSLFSFQWEIEALSDSTSKIYVYVKDVDHSLLNKLRIPFSDTDFEKRTKKTLLEFNKELKEHVENFRVTVIGTDSIPSSYCAYVSLSGKQTEKARGMMQNYSMLDQLILKNDIRPNGRPFIEVTKWDIKTDSIHYNFCYPIIKSDSLPLHKTIQYKRFNGKKALKAIYNGNYITSDRAWYALLDYADKNGFKVENKPVEIFYNNPNVGGNELSWKTEVFMPIKE